MERGYQITYSPHTWKHQKSTQWLNQRWRAQNEILLRELRWWHTHSLASDRFKSGCLWTHPEELDHSRGSNPNFLRCQGPTGSPSRIRVWRWRFKSIETSVLSEQFSHGRHILSVMLRSDFSIVDVHGPFVKAISGCFHDHYDPNGCGLWPYHTSCMTCRTTKRT